MMLLLSAAAVIADAPPHGKAMLVLDASGSMWGKVQGKSKIEIARETIRSVVKGWPVGSELGVMAYGHRRESDCEDIELVVPVGPVNGEQIAGVVDRIQPKGKTPLTRSLRLAAEALRHDREQATLILVSDGLESCGLDPCALATELENSGINFTAHVIGFDVAAAEQARLGCIADNTGGRFFAAANASELQAAMQQAAGSVQRSDGLSAYWSFDHCDARDDLAGNDGVLSGEPACVDGIQGKAFRLNGKNNYITIKNNGMGNLHEAATFAIWIKAGKENFNGKSYRVYEKDQANFWVIMIDNSELKLYLRGSSGLGAPDKVIRMAGRDELEDKWVFLSVVKQGDVFSVYVNGRMRASEKTGVKQVVTSNPVTFGRSTYWKAQYYTGLIDEGRFYTRALNADEISALYQRKSQR